MANWLVGFEESREDGSKRRREGGREVSSDGQEDKQECDYVGWLMLWSSIPQGSHRFVLLADPSFYRFVLLADLSFYRFVLLTDTSFTHTCSFFSDLPFTDLSFSQTCLPGPVLIDMSFSHTWPKICPCGIPPIFNRK